MNHLVGVKRPRIQPVAAFLPAPPTISNYDQPLATYDIATYYHDALKVGFTVKCAARQDHHRMRAVEAHARDLLQRGGETLKSIQQRLSVPPPVLSSPDWGKWKDQHLEACRELKEEVKLDLHLGNWPATWSTTLSAIGSKLCARK